MPKAQAPVQQIPPETLAAARNGLDVWRAQVKGIEAVTAILAMVDGAQGIIDGIPARQAALETSIADLTSRVESAQGRLLQADLSAKEAERRGAERRQGALDQADSAEKAAAQRIEAATKRADQAVAEQDQRGQARLDAWNQKQLQVEGAATLRVETLAAQAKALEERISRMRDQDAEMTARARAALGVRG